MLDRRTSALAACALLALPVYAGEPTTPTPALQHRWLFVWRDVGDGQEVDRLIARLPRAQAAGSNGVVVSPAMAPAKAAEFRAAARRHGLDIVAIVMGNSRDRNCTEGLPVHDARFVVRDLLKKDGTAAISYVAARR